jgi:hypothetical protein
MDSINHFIWPIKCSVEMISKIFFVFFCVLNDYTLYKNFFFVLFVCGKVKPFIINAVLLN